MWTAVIILGLAALLAFKAPRALRWLLLTVGALVLVAAVAGSIWWLVNNRKQASLAVQFDADPRSETAPPTLFVYAAKAEYSGPWRWAVFNASPDTAYRCNSRRARFNSAGVKLSAEESRERTFEPLQSDNTYEDADSEWRLQLIACIPLVKGVATVDRVRALMASHDFRSVPLRTRLRVMRAAVAENPPPEAPDFIPDATQAIVEPGDGSAEVVIKNLLAPDIAEIIGRSRRESGSRVVEVDGYRLEMPGDTADTAAAKIVWRYIDRKPE